ATHSLDKVQQRNPLEVTHKTTRRQLQKMTPQFSWKGYFHTLGYPKLGSLIVTAPKFFKNLNEIIKSESLASLKAYLKWNLVASFVPALNEAFVKEFFRFSSENLTGARSMPPRWKRCLAMTE